MVEKEDKQRIKEIWEEYTRLKSVVEYQERGDTACCGNCIFFKWNDCDPYCRYENEFQFYVSERGICNEFVCGINDINT